MVQATDENQIKAMKQYLRNDVPITYWWMDAGWYFRTGEESLKVWLDTGTWMPDTTRFPSKFKDISDFGAENGVKTLLWFEPEVVRLDWADHDVTNGIPKEYMLDNNLADFGNEGFVPWAVCTCFPHPGRRWNFSLQTGLWNQSGANFNALNTEKACGNPRKSVCTRLL